MSLVDLSSDLSKFRSEVSKEPKSTPEASKATNNKNFATFQPITAKLSQFGKPVERQEPKQLETKLSSTKLDDVRKLSMESVLLNSVSRYSAINEDYNTRNIGNSSLEDIASRFDDIRRDEFVSRLTSSKVQITRQNVGTNNLTSPINLNIVENDAVNNIVNPNVQIERPVQSFDREETSPEIIPNKEDASDNITIPNIQIEDVVQSMDRTKQSVVINKDLFSPLNNVIDPKIALDTTELTFDREGQSPNIITDTIQQGLVTNPDIKIIRIEQGTFHLDDESNLNIDTQPVKFVTTSRLAEFEPSQDPDTERYNQETIQSTDNSILNLDTIIRTNPIGRHESPENSGFSIIGIQQVNFFPDSQVKGFVVKAQQGVTSYVGDSVFGWSGNRTSAPTTNFIDDVNGRGFKKFANTGETDYNTESSAFGFTRPPETDFFDVTKNYVSEGFKTFVTAYQTAYKPDASVFTWSGKREQAPETNYFDENSTNSNAGFHKFAQIYDTKYIPNSSQFDWDGNREAAPESNFFDLNGSNSNAGFHKFAQIYDTKYIPESSIYNWDGNREAAPESNFFDITGTNSTVGFHKFAQIYDSKLIAESSIYNWDGNRDAAPESNFFDVNGTNSNAGFHKFAQLYDSKYIADSSQFDWDGSRQDAPEINYFDFDSKNTGAGFHKFAQLYDSKYIADSSQFDWDGNNQNSPEANFFDTSAKNASTGFHRFAQLYDSKYIVDSSQYNWDGDRQKAPEVNYFDINSSNAVGFHKFAQLYDTKYVHQSSQFDWDGARQDAPEINYFDLNGTNTSNGFHKFAQLYDSKYINESSLYDWEGTRQSAPEIDKFDLTKSSANRGFERLTPSMVSRYVRDASRFTFKGSSQSAPEIDTVDKNRKYAVKGFERFPQRLVTKYVKDASEYDFNGTSRSAPKTNFFPDTQGKGFTTFPEKLNSEYSKDISEFTFKGSLPKEVNFFPDTNASGFINKTPSLETKFEHESSEFAFKGSTPDPVDFLSNTNGSGFDLKIQLNDSKYVNDSSQFTFKGDGKSAKAANFFGDTNATGFTSFPQSLVSEYVGQSTFGISGGGRQESEIINGVEGSTSGAESKLASRESGFGWQGSRQDAPEVDYFKIQGTNPNGIAGFTKLFDNTETKLTDEFSRFSFAAVKNRSKIKNAPYTTFFGYTPSERTGFMTGMTSGESTLYPIIDPLLKYDEIPNRRFEIESARGQRRNIQTANREKYAPLSLGKRPWANGTLSATLENQVPGIITGATAGSFDAPYERGVKDNTEQRGYLTKWAITRRSPSPLDKQYSKFNLRNDSFNRDIIWNQPFVLRGIQGGLEPERWGGPLHFINDGIARAGIATMVDRIIFDGQRIGKFLTSIKGIAWNLRQVGLQLMNPVVDIDPVTSESVIDGYSSTHIFNPLSVAANVATARTGFHVARHGSKSFDSSYLNRYETATKNRELTQENKSEFQNLAQPTKEDKTKYNRLIGLMKELLPGSFKPFVGATQPTPPPQDGAEDPNNNGVQTPSSNPLPARSSEIVRISSTSRGPQSFLGVGGTVFNRPSHPYLTFYTTAPSLYSGNNEPGYLDTAKRDTFYSVSSTYSQEMKNSGLAGIMKAFAYALTNGPKIANEESEQGTLPSSVQKDVLDSIQKSDTFTPKYDTIESRLERKTKDSITKTETLLANSNHPSNVDKDGLIKQYRVASYDRLKKNDARASRYFNDFRRDIDVDWASQSDQENPARAFVSNPSVMRFDTRNLTERFGFGDQGRPGIQRDSPYVSNIEYKVFQNDEIIRDEGPAQFREYPIPVEKSGKYFRGDRINIIDYKRANFDLNTKIAYELGNTNTGIPGTRDLIEFYFSSLVLSGHRNCPAEVIVFRATFGNITDNHKPSWNAIKYMGRGDPLYTYQGYEREVSFDFKVHIGSRDELRASWRKLNYLASWTAPEYRDDGTMRGPMVRLNIGHLYRKMPGYISSLSYTFDNTQTTWETAKLPEDMTFTDEEIRNLSYPGALQLPKHIDINVSFVPVGLYRPEFRGIMYNLYDDTAEGNNVESGLMPMDASRVNYFIEYFKGKEPVIYTGTVEKNGKRVSYSGDPVQKLDIPEDPDDKNTPTGKTASAEGQSTNAGDKPGTTTKDGTGDVSGDASNNTETTPTKPLVPTDDKTIPSFLMADNTGTTGNPDTTNTGVGTPTPGQNPPTPLPPPAITKNEAPQVKTTTPTLSPTASEAEQKIYNAVHSSLGADGLPGTWPFTFWLKMRGAEKDGFPPYPPGKDAAIAALRDVIPGRNPDGTSTAEVFADQLPVR